jgi:2-hydroxychromene-2-carboxylate isomerase
MTRRLKVYSDYKSPYAYLAKDLTYELERQTGVTLDWLPYTLDIPAYLGSAKVDGERAGAKPQRTSMAPRQIQLHGLPPRGELSRANHPRASEDFRLAACQHRALVRQTARHLPRLSRPSVRAVLEARPRQMLSI